jgi:hypothetical protein
MGSFSTPAASAAQNSLGVLILIFLDSTQEGRLAVPGK